eukprot:1900339-Amphidinium_carterae.1
MLWLWSMAKVHQEGAAACPPWSVEPLRHRTASCYDPSQPKAQFDIWIALGARRPGVLAKFSRPCPVSNPSGVPHSRMWHALKTMACHKGRSGAVAAC